MNYRKRYQRHSSGRDFRKTILIVCEGEKTEPYYFQAFDTYNKDKYYLKIEGLGYNTLSLVKETVSLIREAKSLRQEYEQVWCVFDKDLFSDADFNGAVDLANANKIQCAYSNESFELWFILHFEYWQSASTRDAYCAKLDELLASYGGYSKTSDEIYAILKGKQEIAIGNARKLLQDYDVGVTPSKQNPATTVFLLVEALNNLRA
ncbi:MAG: RloB family protein [Elusimicrobiota bacterium]|nr:RloB family protein [Elusimicrobiota bacterium]